MSKEKNNEQENSKNPFAVNETPKFLANSLRFITSTLNIGLV